ncbi:DNA-binding XRE family transcriptional regulator [Lewinella aquimaris]|uniref:DNA-binding XRE family transcriptional regulator n=1 Tax=Neolewinella aquimaris TaxID=1835722 RepID=A0A840EAH5_9BACT|nr:helix-turn-helix transcriptional regulator [Neolewinella aquimaris]MBB4077996.1 DNA-binding XRE family transcriptional regulator [Neolewinella aquimaris]
MKGLRSIPRVLKINKIDGFKLSLLFNNGQSRIIDIEQFFRDSPSGRKELREQILSNQEIFDSVEVMDTTIGWPGIGIYSKDQNGESVFYSYDIDPILLFKAGTVDEDRKIDIGEKIKSLRLQLGLTQEELAKKSGTSKHYISRLENNKSDIEVMTLKKIIEAGFNKKLSLEIK